MQKYPRKLFAARMTGDLEGSQFFNIALEGNRIARKLVYRGGCYRSLVRRTGSSLWMASPLAVFRNEPDIPRIF